METSLLDRIRHGLIGAGEVLAHALLAVHSAPIAQFSSGRRLSRAPSVSHGQHSPAVNRHRPGATDHRGTELAGIRRRRSRAVDGPPCAR